MTARVCKWLKKSESVDTHLFIALAYLPVIKRTSAAPWQATGCQRVFACGIQDFTRALGGRWTMLEPRAAQAEQVDERLKSTCHVPHVQVKGRRAQHTDKSGT